MSGTKTSSLLAYSSERKRVKPPMARGMIRGPRGSPEYRHLLMWSSTKGSEHSTDGNLAKLFDDTSTRHSLRSRSMLSGSCDTGAEPHKSGSQKGKLSKSARILHQRQGRLGDRQKLRNTAAEAVIAENVWEQR